MDVEEAFLLNMYLKQSSTTLSLLQESVNGDQAFLQTFVSKNQNLEKISKKLLPAVRNRRTWEWEKYSEFWERTCQSWPDDVFITRFRVSRESFASILQLVEPELTRQVTTMRKSISQDKRLAMAFCFYATGEEFSVLADNFGVGVSTFRGTVFAFLKSPKF